MRRSRGRFAAALVGLLLVAGCASSDGDDFIVPLVPPAKIDVDTPALRAAKNAAGIQDCAPGDADNDLPAVTLPCFGGGPDVALDTLRGPLVVSFWGSYCGPCRQELPYYEKLAQEYAGRVSVIGVDFTDPQTEGAMQLLADTGATFPQLADPGGDLSGRRPLPPLTGLPVVLFVDADGSFETQQVQIGQITSYAELQELVQTHLGVAP
jgi:thiol-disulfide isomerase/thioredoxin